jgi:hypothetical protein
VLVLMRFQVGVTTSEAAGGVVGVDEVYVDPMKDPRSLPGGSGKREEIDGLYCPSSSSLEVGPLLSSGKALLVDESD